MRGRLAMLVAMVGLPGAGKSAVADDVARSLGCAVLSVDPVEAAMWQAGISPEQPTGMAAYQVVELLAAEQLALGHDVIVDAVNAVEPARDQWRGLAERTGTALRFIEVHCSDENEHQRRLAARVRNLDGFPEPTWDYVLATRGSFEDWSDERLVLDSMDPRPDNLRRALQHLR